MRKFLIIIGLITIGFLITSCSEKSGKPKKEWTVLIYMNGDNSLSDSINPDINQMEASQFDEEKMNIIVQADYNIYAPDPRPCIYDVKNDANITKISSPKIKNLSEVDSGDWSVVANFLNWGMKEYPAEKYAIIMWSHGNGWMPKKERFSSFFPDNVTHNYISIVDGDYNNLFKSLKNKVDVLILDACNMQTMENLSELPAKVDFVVGSEQTVPDTGFPYDDVFRDWSNLDKPRDFAISASEDYFNSYQPGGSQNFHGDNFPISICAVDMSKFSEFRNRFMDFLETNQRNISAQSFLSARENSVEFNDLEWDVDIVEFLHNLKNEVDDQSGKSRIDSLITFSNELFISAKSYDYFTYYVGQATICFPKTKEDYGYLIERYEKLEIAKDTYWTQFLRDILN